MKYRPFGKTGVNVSEIGVGTWSMVGMWGARDDTQAIKAMIRAIEHGVTFIDTAWIYGNGHSEQLIAKTFQEMKRSVFVATKIPPNNLEWPARVSVPLHKAYTADHIVKYTEISLNNLNVDSLDLQQLHVWTDRWQEGFEDSLLTAIEKLKRQGKIRFFGVSLNAHDPNSGLRLVKSGLIDSVQVIYNIFDQTPEEKLFPVCEFYNVAVIARCPFDEGALAGALTPDTNFELRDWRRSYFRGKRLEETCDRVEKLEFLIRPDRTLAQTALQFCLAHPAITTVIPSMRTMKHVDENCAASHGKYLSEEELRLLKHHAWPRNFYMRAPGTLVRILRKLGL